MNVPGRECGSCMMCCKVTSISEPELQKPCGIWCQHAIKGRGCGIYDARPRVCRDFHCHWLINSNLGPEWKPERCKFVLFGNPNIRNVIEILVDPAFPNAWMKPPYYETIKRWAVDAAERNRFVLIQIGSRFVAVLPDRVTELGKVDATDTFVLKRSNGPSGPQFEVSVKSAGELNQIAKRSG
jgi:hypothetical protein